MLVRRFAGTEGFSMTFLIISMSISGKRAVNHQQITYIYNNNNNEVPPE